jgi:uncharacterized Fe-S cluster protein YjdI
VGSFGYRRGSEMSTPPRLRPREYAADEIVVEWHPALCFHSLNCVKTLPRVFDSARGPWIDPGQASADEIEAAVDGCPSAALRSRRFGATAPAAPPEPEVSPMPNGPLLMRGPIRVVRADGSSEELPRAAFCRCGQSNNKPFCDGTHREVGFKE